jgi:hypothetical protein
MLHAWKFDVHSVGPLSLWLGPRRRWRRVTPRSRWIDDARTYVLTTRGDEQLAFVRVVR